MIQRAALGRKTFQPCRTLSAAARGVAVLLVVQTVAHAEPLVLMIDKPVEFTVEPPKCPGANERAVLSVRLGSGAIEPGTGILVTAKPPGRFVGTIVPFGPRTGAPVSSHRLVLPKDLPLCIGNTPQTLQIKLTLKPPDDIGIWATKGTSITIHDASLTIIPAAN